MVARVLGGSVSPTGEILTLTSQINSVTGLPRGQESTGGSAHVLGQELGLTAFDNQAIVGSPISAANIPIFTVPAGCRTVEFAAIKTTVGSYIAFTGMAFIRINAAAGSSSGSQIITANDRFRIGVTPGDVINWRGDTGVAGHIAIIPLG